MFLSHLIKETFYVRSHSKLKPELFQESKLLRKSRAQIVLCHSKQTGERIVAKRFNHLDLDHTMLPRFLNEVAVGRLFDHPHVMGFERAFATRSQGIILMDFAEEGDLYDCLMSYPQLFSEKVVRTFFHQLLAGVEYLHSKEIAHLDLKPENLLITAAFSIKIADFDLAQKITMAYTKSQGTCHYRAPEVQKGLCENYRAADVYSCGVILFLLYCKGVLPSREDEEKYDTVKLRSAMLEGSSLFWEKHCWLQNRPPEFFPPAFQELFEGMIAQAPLQRFTIENIKQSRWFKGPVLTQDELSEIFKSAKAQQSSDNPGEKAERNDEKEK